MVTKEEEYPCVVIGTCRRSCGGFETCRQTYEWMLKNPVDSDTSLSEQRKQAARQKVVRSGAKGVVVGFCQNLVGRNYKLKPRL